MPSEKLSSPVSFVIISALKWSRTMEEPTNTMSMSLRCFISASVSRA